MTLTFAQRLLLSGLALGALSACAGTGKDARLQAPEPITPTEQYALTAQQQVNTINLRVNPNGLSANQLRALDQVADQASWVADAPVDLEIVTGSDPQAVAAGRSIAGYLMTHDVPRDSMQQFSREEQPGDIVTVNIVAYRAHTYACNQSWENLAATGSNKPYKNFGCAVTSNLAAQIADPRDLDGPAPATSTDAARKSVILDKYRKGEVTSAAKDEQSTGAISNAIK